VGAQAVRNHRDIQSHESAILLSQLMQQPDDFVMSVERYSCSVVSIIGWGRRIRRKDDPIVERALNIMHVTAQIFVPGDYWMETIPLLQKLPSWVYALPTALKKGRQGMMTYWYALSKESAENDDREFFSKALFEDKAEGLLPLEIGSLTSNLIGGGVDTTTSTMLSFILACIAFPEALKKAQEELDRVVGQNRLPDWSDENSLPYCRAMIKKALRWRSVAILGELPPCAYQR
jgi:cytochrome P450